MKSSVNSKQRTGLLKILLSMFVLSWVTPSNAVTIDEFLLLDKTLLLNTGLTSSDGRALSLRADLGREQIRALGVRRGFGREMLRMGREFSLYLRARSDVRVYGARFLRDARVLTLRQEARGRLSLLSLNKAREILSGRYLLGTRRTVEGRESSLFANFSILDDTMLWSVSDKSGSSIFAMSSYRSVPEPAGLLLLLTGLLGLVFVMFYRPGIKK